MKLKNKKALITGASRGIGRAVTDNFIREGAEVWGMGTKEPDDLPGRIKEAGGKLHWITADLAELERLEETIKCAITESCGFDILVNNAGITKDNLSFRMSLEEWQKVLDITLARHFL